MSTTTFIGVDLAWTAGPTSGIAIGRADSGGVEIVSLTTRNDLSGVVEAIDLAATEHTIIAIDAPLVITNEAGARECEKAINRRFGANEASCHSTNLQKYGDGMSIRLVRELASRGIVQQPRPHTTGDRDGRWCFEVYPHPAQVVLFNLARTLKYKKGSVAQRREGLADLRARLRLLSSADPPLAFSEAHVEFLYRDINALRGKALKAYEDQLDACFCAYLAFYYWRYGTARNEIFGSTSDGYIIVPSLKREPHNRDRPDREESDTGEGR